METVEDQGGRAEATPAFRPAPGTAGVVMRIEKCVSSAPELEIIKVRLANPCVIPQY